MSDEEALARPLLPDDDPSAAPLVARLGRLESRLDALLAAGWRQSGHHLPYLLGEAQSLSSLGLDVLAAPLLRLRTAGSAHEALAAISSVQRISRLLRLRLGADLAPPSRLAPLRPTSAPAPERLLLVSRTMLDRQETWTAVRLDTRGAAALLLLEPFEVPRDVEPWLGNTHLLSGTTRWLRRQALGAETVDVVRVAEPTWVPTRGADDDPVQALRQLLSTEKWAGSQSFVPSAWPLRLLPIGLQKQEPTWLEPGIEDLVRGAARSAWMVAWVAGSFVVPLALFRPADGNKTRGRLVHPHGSTTDFLS